MAWLTSTLMPASARALICCSVAMMGLSAVCCGDIWSESPSSAGVMDDVDLRGGMVGMWCAACWDSFDDDHRYAVRLSGCRI